ASFVAILGAAGFAIGFALQGSLSNLAAGMLLMFFRPVRVGDLVEVAGIEGIVGEIGVFATILNTLDNKRVTVANAKVTENNIVNYTINGKLRVDMTFGIGYGDDVDRAMAILQRCIEEEPLILKDPEPMVAVSAHGDSAVEIVCRPWCDPADYWDLWFAMHRSVKKAFDAEGIEIPFPQRDVHLHQPAG
ncbi:MAG: mechanosensitive ion channel family protein, partial [Planctomycetota bacterium]